ncbi:MAG TPA: porin family protein [Hanamia sp.]|nr:porin family protein [Hanamia sp.]
MKNIFLLLGLVFVSTFSFAQTTPAFGVKAGILSSGMRGDAVNSFNNVLDFTNGKVTTKDFTGFFAGGYASIPMNSNLTFEPGIYYSLKGYEMDGSIGLKGMDFLGANAKAILQSQYVDVPVLLKGNFGGFQIFAGPQISYLTQSNLKTTAGVLGINLLNKSMDVTSQFNRWDVGVTGGIGYQFTNGLNLSASYDYGLSKVDANQSINAFNRGIKVGIGMTF